MVGVGAAADSVRLRILAGDLVISPDADLNLRLIGADVEGGRVALYGDFRRAADLFGDDGGDLLPAHGGGIAAVHGLEHAAVLHADDAAHDGQGLEQAVVRLNAQTPAVIMLVEHGHGLQEAALLSSGNAAVQNVVDKHADGVHRVLRQGGVSAQAGGRQVPKALFSLLRRDSLRILQRLVRLYPGLRLIGHGVGGKAAPDIHDVLHGHV